MNGFLYCCLLGFGLPFYAQEIQNNKPTTQIEILYNQALNLSYQENFSAALPLFDSLIAMNAQIDLLFFDRGMIKKHLGDFSGAILDFSEQIKQTPQEADAYFLRGELLLQEANFRAAYNDLKKVTKADAGNADAHCYLAKAAAELGKSFVEKRHSKYCKANPHIH